MKQLYMRFVLALLSTVDATDNKPVFIRSVNTTISVQMPIITMLPNCSFIIDCEKNRDFAKFRDTYKEKICTALCLVKCCKWDDGQAAILSKMTQDVVDVMTISCYYKYQRELLKREIQVPVRGKKPRMTVRERRELDQKMERIAIEVINRLDVELETLCLDGVTILNIPVDAIAFAKPKCLSMKCMGIKKDVERLAKITTLTTLLLDGNLLESIPNTSEFGNLEVLSLTGNNIVISHKNQINLGKSLKTLHLDGNESISVFGPKLLRLAPNTVFKGSGIFRGLPVLQRSAVSQVSGIPQVLQRSAVPQVSGVSQTPTVLQRSAVPQVSGVPQVLQRSAVSQVSGVSQTPTVLQRSAVPQVSGVSQTPTVFQKPPVYPRPVIHTTTESLGSVLFKGSDFLNDLKSMEGKVGREVTIDYTPIGHSSIKCLQITSERIKPEPTKSRVISYCKANEEFLKFRASYYQEFKRNVFLINEGKTVVGVTPDMLKILNENPNIVDDIADLAAADYFNRYYINWWEPLICGPNAGLIDYEIRDDIIERNLLLFDELYLNNIVLSCISYSAFKFLSPKKLWMKNCYCSINEIYRLFEFLRLPRPVITASEFTNMSIKQEPVDYSDVKQEPVDCSDAQESFGYQNTQIKREASDDDNNNVSSKKVALVVNDSKMMVQIKMEPMSDEESNSLMN